MKHLIYDIATADCYGGWIKLLEDVSYSGIATSDEQHFLEAGDWARIAAVRKSGFVPSPGNIRICHPNQIAPVFGSMYDISFGRSR